MTENALSANGIALADGSSPSGAMLIDTVLAQVIQQGLQQIKADTSVIDSIFYKLPDATRTDIKAWLAVQNIPVYVNYPDADLPVPLVAVVNESDDELEQQDYLGDMLGEEGVMADGSIAYTYGIRERSTFNILCIANQDADNVLWLYFLVKAILLASKPLLMSQGLSDPLTLRGQDLSYREDMPAEWCFMRALTLTCTHTFSIYLTEQAAQTLVVQALPGVPLAVEF